MRRGRSVLFLMMFVFVAALTSCAEENAPLLPGTTSNTPDASLPTGVTPSSGIAVCTQAHAQSLPARLAAMSTSAPSGGNVLLASDLFQTFNEVCAPCHTAAADP